MSYLYDPTAAGDLLPNAQIPLSTVPAHVLMTAESAYYAGPGEEVMPE
jgi:hypothetical protein